MPSLLPLALGLCAALPSVLQAQSAASAQARPGSSAPAGAQRQASQGGGIGYEKTVPHIESGPWKGARLPDGQPDIQGDWSNTIANHDNLTDPQGGIPGDPQGARRRASLGARDTRAPSRVSDPEDGQVPFLPWARQVQQLLLTNSFNPVKPEFVEPLARCAPAGIPKSYYWHGYEIRQYPGYIIFLFNSGNRIIHLSDKPHLPGNIKLWMGDARGHWEGNTLVVDTDNLNGKARFGRTQEFVSENVHVTERFIFDSDNKRFNYVATFTDPAVLSRPFTVTVPAKRWTAADKTNGWHYEVSLANAPGKPAAGDHYERVCVENDTGFGRVAQPTAANAGVDQAAGGRN